MKPRSQAIVTELVFGRGNLAQIKNYFFLLFVPPLSQTKSALFVPKEYCQNLLQRAEATQFNPYFQVKEISVEDVELVKRQWLWKPANLQK